MKVLIIDNNINKQSWGSADLCRMVRNTPHEFIHVRRAPQEDLPLCPQNYDRIIISGSKTSALDDAPWIDRLFEFTLNAIHHEIPLLGICYGHQVLARTLGGKRCVRKSETPEFGWTQIQVIEQSDLLTGLPSSFFSFSAHFDEVQELPAGMKKLALSERCGIQACQFKNLPIFSIQFHPEKTLEEAKTILSERKKKKNPPELLNPEISERLYNPKIGETLFRNFLEI